MRVVRIHCALSNKSEIIRIPSIQLLFQQKLWVNFLIKFKISEEMITERVEINVRGHGR